MDDVEVRAAAPTDWQMVKEVRLAALADAPQAFGSTLAREQAFDDAEWRRRVAPGNWFLADRGGRVVGVAAGFAETDDPAERHLVAMWVTPDQRGTSAATQLVEAVCKWAIGEGASSVTLYVADGNPRARRFYERVGFEATGARAPLPSNPEIGEELMRRKLTPPRVSEL